MGDAKYRFLPWTRRGLSGAIDLVDNGGPLRGRANISVGITVSNVMPAGVNLSLYGPGDVLGIDQRLIVRTAPIAGTTNVEPNYFAGIEFDPPDFVWMFTPAKANDKNRLRPWLVLIVVDRAVVQPPQADRARPLPVITIPVDVSAQELPDLSESWAWAHSQMMTEDGAVNLASELANKPDLNISRLLCPRRLKPGKQYIACLVPAFDAGVERGLGGKPDPTKNLSPAWDSANPGTVILPVYYHWEFATGPLGDFESLARKLKPFESPDSVGVAPMYIGDGGPQLPLIPPEQSDGTVMMDGALRSPSRSPGTLADISNEIAAALRNVLNTPAQQLSEGPSDATHVLGPPIYGQWHQNQHTLPPDLAGWLAELNQDPRARVAAGLGAEIVRKFQEDFMQECWEQVGEVLKANSRLSWGRLALEANRRVYERHYKPLATDRFLQITQPLLARTLLQDTTILAKVDQTSLPSALVDPAFRRITSPQRPLLKKAVQRLTSENRLNASFANTLRSSLLRTTSDGRAEVDPTQFTPDGLKGTVVLNSLVGAEFNSVAGVEIAPATVQILKKETQPFTTTDFQQNPLQLGVRDTLRQSGLVTVDQIDNVRVLFDQPDGSAAPQLNIHSVTSDLIKTTVKDPNAKGIRITIPKTGNPILNPVSLGRNGAVLIGELGSDRVTEIGTIDVSSLGNRIDINTILLALPAGTFTGNTNPNISVGVTGDLIVRDTLTRPLRSTTVPLTGTTSGLGTNPVLVRAQPLREVARPMTSTTLSDATPLRPRLETVDALMTNTLSLPAKDAQAITRFEQVMSETIREIQFNTPVLGGMLVAFPLAQSAKTVLGRIDPVVMVPRRLQQIVNIQNGQLWNSAAVDIGLNLTPTFDRIMAAPDLPMPVYQYLADYAQESFCPGVGAIPPDSLTLLETNPSFIESFMVGLNYEMNRELLWREYPSDQRGTPFRHFWDWIDNQPDIEPIHRWNKLSLLGRNSRGAGAGGQIVLLIRGELLRRYPNTVIVAWKATANGLAMIDPPGVADIKEPVFQGKLNPDIAFAGFDLRDDEILQNGGWFFVLQEQPTEPRFGLDVGLPDQTGQPQTWNDATWVQTGVGEGQHLKLSEAGTLTNLLINSLKFGENSAHMASITLQKPMRIAVHARHLV
jgi:hypothetical protein